MTAAGRREVECKAPLPEGDDAEGWAARLGELGEWVGERVSEDTYFGPGDVGPEETDAFRHRVFRLRETTTGAVVTLKEKRIDGAVESSREVEFGVESGDAFRSFAAGLGYRPFIVKRKRVRAYRVGECTVELVHVDGLGDFLEIEHLSEEGTTPEEDARARVLEVLGRLGVAESALEPRLYIDMLRGR